MCSQAKIILETIIGYDRSLSALSGNFLVPAFQNNCPLSTFSQWNLPNFNSESKTIRNAILQSENVIEYMRSILQYWSSFSMHVHTLAVFSRKKIDHCELFCQDSRPGFLCSLITGGTWKGLGYII